MTHRSLARFMVLAFMAVAGSLWSVSLAGQSQATPASLKKTTTKPRSAPRAADGRPDLQGTWANSTLTPLQRPKGFEDRPYYREAETEAFQKAVLDEDLALLGEVELKTNGEL